MNKLISLCLALICFNVFAADDTNGPSALSATAAKKFTFVIVPGAWGGGWDWKTVDDLLTAKGNKVYRATLTGLGERSHLASTNIDLNTHITDVVNLILWENLHNVVLVGHSYGGMVITGVADRITERIKDVIYIDAMVPESGESAYKIRSAGTNLPPLVGAYVIPNWLNTNSPPPNYSPQPVATFTQPITLTNQAIAQSLPTTYILTVDKGRAPEQDDFYKFYVRAKARGWTTEIMEGEHSIQHSRPDEVARLLEKAPQ